jgi:hypothetical protein
LTDRIRPALLVYVFGVLGVFLAAAPWTAVWDAGTRFLLPTGAAAWARSGWVRGAVSGLGLLDLGVAVAEGAGLLRLLRRDGGSEGD